MRAEALNNAVRREEADEQEPDGSAAEVRMTTYEIVVEGRVQGSLMWALEGFEAVPGGERETRFRGHVADQIELHRVLKRISGCNVRLTSVTKVEERAEPTTDP